MEHRHIKVACTAPVPRLAVSALKELTGWTAEPFLVPDSTLERLMTAYAALSEPMDRDRVVARDEAGANETRRGANEAWALAPPLARQGDCVSLAAEGRASSQTRFPTPRAGRTRG